MRQRAGNPDLAGWRGVLPAVCVLLIGLSFLAGLAASPKEWRGQLALVFSPKATTAEIVTAVAAMEARLVRNGGLGNLVVVSFDRETSYAELRRHGAWLALDPVLLGACSLLTAEPSPEG